jgi:Arc/MetJ family transcription regulator
VRWSETGCVGKDHPEISSVRVVTCGADADNVRKGIYIRWLIYTSTVAKHLVDIDEAALHAARLELGTGTIRDTVNTALRRASGEIRATTKRRLDALAHADLAAREDAWR